MQATSLYTPYDIEGQTAVVTGEAKPNLQPSAWSCSAVGPSSSTTNSSNGVRATISMIALYTVFALVNQVQALGLERQLHGAWLRRGASWSSLPGGWTGWRSSRHNWWRRTR